jgi:hypothetical protein
MCGVMILLQSSANTKNYSSQVMRTMKICLKPRKHVHGGNLYGCIAYTPYE